MLPFLFDQQSICPCTNKKQGLNKHFVAKANPIVCPKIKMENEIVRVLSILLRKKYTHVAIISFSECLVVTCNLH